MDSELPKSVKSRAVAVAGRVVFAKTLEPAIADTWMVVGRAGTTRPQENNFW